MKNIHLIPTDKPSSIWINYVADRLIHGQFTSNDTKINCQNQHIYITSDEEIKAGNWTINSIGELNKYKGGVFFTTWKKIILTTDQDLISYGIQSIDDEFLELFCSQNGKIIEPSTRLKNSLKQFNMSLEESINLNPVELQKIGFGNRSIIELQNMENETENLKNYKKLKSNETSGAMKDFVEQKEILEEIAERFFTKRAKEEGFENWTQIIVEQEWGLIESFPIEFAKWQQERSYSEEDVISTFHYGHQVGMNSILAIQSQHSPQPIPKPDLEILKKEWFEQFKKK